MNETTARLPSGISVVVPVYNSRATLAELIDRLQAALEAIGIAYEAVLVNDGSRDQSWAVVQRLCAQYHWVRGIDLMRNYGQENALLCGIRAAAYDTIVTMDDDLQHPPEEIGALIAALGEQWDVVYGTTRRERHGLWRRLAAGVNRLALRRAMGIEAARDVTAFKAFKTQLRNAFSLYRSPSVSIDVLLTWGTQRFGAVQVRHDARPAGRSNFTFRRLVNHAINMATGFTVLPLQVASILGLLMAVVGLAGLGYVLTDYFLRGDPVPGFPFLAAIICLFCGAQMFALGVMGEYLARVHQRSMDRPPYTVRTSTAASVDAADAGRRSISPSGDQEDAAAERQGPVAQQPSLRRE